jgi:protein-S-isoprenylcysteine O-methyltransferase Ste14
MPLAIRAVLAMALPATVAGLVPWLLLDGVTLGHLSLWRLLCLVPMIAGLLLLIASIVLFAVDGHGTLAPVDPPLVFVARGPYRVTRNPMYVGVALWLIGLASLTADLRLAGYALCVLGAFHLFVMFIEEPSLRRRFGAPYEAYTQRVPRWIGFPRLRKRP